MKFIKLALITSSIVSATAIFNPAYASVCLGNCGTSGADGDVSLPPSGAAEYDWVSTAQGEWGVGQLAGYSGTNGSVLTSDPFFAAQGSTVEFYFNYITSDGSSYADYAWSQLSGVSNETTLFTARTKPSGNIVPGQDLPGVTAELSPASVAINPNATNWSPLGESSGACWADGCGSTGWVKSIYTIEANDTYTLSFGVTNFGDTALDSGLAFQGLTLDGLVIGDGTSEDSPLLPQEIGEDGSFNFSFTPTPAETVFIDPDVATGYDYLITEGSNLITSAVFPILPDDVDGYEVYGLDNTFLGSVLGGETFDFSAPVSGFNLSDIDTAAYLDPADTNAFVTGLNFLDNSAVSVAQTPITTFVADPIAAVPEPSAYALFAGGLGVVGFMAMRRQRKQKQA